MEALKKHAEDYPDAYQYERAKVFGVSPNCILYALRRLYIPHHLPNSINVFTDNAE